MKRFLLCLSSVILAGQLIAAEPPSIPVPNPDAVLRTLKKTHPRLLATKEDFARLKAAVQTNDTQAGFYKHVQQSADTLLKQEPSKYEIPDGLRLLATSRQVMVRIYTLGLTYHLTGDARYAERAWNELEAAGNFKDWNPRHFLDTAEMTHAFAIGYDWLYDYWTPERRAFLREAITTKGLKLGIEGYTAQKKKWWGTTYNNWNQVCNGGIGMGALAIADKEPALAGTFLNNALKSLQIPMPRFAPDGGWDEGPGYWNYATLYNVIFLAGLDSALGTDFGLSKIQGFSQTGFFPLYLSSPANHVFNFADGSDHVPRPAQLFWFARKFDEPAFASFALQQPELSALSLLWFDPAQPKPAAALPLDRYFREVEVATFRGDWENKDATFVGLKAGKNGISHSHLDLGSFVLDALGERWAIDQGADNYNLPGFFGSQRWTYYRLRAEGHNTLVLNPTSDPDQKTDAQSRIIRFESKPKRAFAIADLSDAYNKDAQKVRRGIALLNRKNVLIQDEVAGEKPAELWWFMHTPATIQLNGTSATLRIGQKTLTATILSPASAVFTNMPAAPLPSSPNPEDQAKNHISKLAIHLTGVKDLRIAVILSPGEHTPDTSIKTITALEKW